VTASRQKPGTAGFPLVFPTIFARGSREYFDKPLYTGIYQ
jgi:hypothetical protein